MRDYRESFGRISGDMRARIFVSSALVGILSGFIIVAYRASIAYLEHTRYSFMGRITASASGFFLWAFLAVIAGLATAAMTRASPLIRGSGIPQVKAYLMRRIPFNWMRELPLKFAGGSLALGAGLSLGREGPSIQLGSLVGVAVSDLAVGKRYKRYLVTAGAAAGISAAFNAPLAGVLFCVEELHRNISPLMLTSSLIASFCANAVMWMCSGNAPVFSIGLANVLPLRAYFSDVLIIGIAAGLAGTLFNYALILFQKKYKRIVPNDFARLASAFLLGALVCVLIPKITGGGNELINAQEISGYSLIVLLALLAAKFAFTLVSYASGAPGGIFLPMLSLGALLGAVCMKFFPLLGFTPEYLNNYLLLGMVAFFTAVVRAPITGAVLITEMAGSLSHFPAFIFVSVIATIVASMLHTKPIYDSLLGNFASDEIPTEDTAPEVIHIPVLEGSILASMPEWQELLPDACVPVSIERGEDEIFPGQDRPLHPGDVLKVIAEAKRAKGLRPILENLGEPAREPHA